MCDHGNNADCTNRKERQEQTVIARIPSQTGFHTLTHGTRDISGGVLDCLDVTELKQPDGGFAPVRVKGVVMFPFDLSTLIGIVWNVLKGNLSGFFGDLGSALSAKGPTSPSNG